MAKRTAEQEKPEKKADSRSDQDALPGTQSIVRTCQILRLVGSSGDGVTVTEVSKAVGLPKSSAHRYLKVLEAQRLVERDEDATYRVGLGLLILQSRRADLLVQRARPLMEALRDQFDETVNLGVLSRDRIVYLDILESTKNIRHAGEKGAEDFIHSTALGKAIAASMSDRDVLELLVKTGMERRTAKTITEPAVFLRELTEVRKKGYAVDDGENEEEARCVAVLIPGLSTPAALSISGVASRFPHSTVAKVADALKTAAAQLGVEPAVDSSETRPSTVANKATKAKATKKTATTRRRK